MPVRNVALLEEFPAPKKPSRFSSRARRGGRDLFSFAFAAARVPSLRVVVFFLLPNFDFRISIFTPPLKCAPGTTAPDFLAS